MNIHSPDFLLKKLKTLPQERIAEIDGFVVCGTARDEQRALTQAAGVLAAESLRNIWDNAEDAGYDEL